MSIIRVYMNRNVGGGVAKKGVFGRMVAEEAGSWKAEESLSFLKNLNGCVV